MYDGVGSARSCNCGTRFKSYSVPGAFFLNPANYRVRQDVHESFAALRFHLYQGRSSMKNIKIIVAFTSVLAVIICCFPASAETMPVFKLSASTVPDGKANEIFNDTFNVSKSTPAIRRVVRDNSGTQLPELKKQQKTTAMNLTAQSIAVNSTDTKTTWTLEKDDQLVELDRRSGFLFVADFNVLWKPDRKSDLPEKGEARKIANDFIARHKLMPEGKFVNTTFSGFSQTAAGADIPGKTDVNVLDRQINYAVTMDIDGRSVPVVGGGGELKVTVGDQGKIIGFLGGWRPIEDVVEQVEIIPAENILAQIAKSFDKAKVSDLQADIAYFSAPGFEAQEVLAPVWVVRGSVEAGGEMIPIRTQIIAATEQYGPVMVPGSVAPKRNTRIKNPTSKRQDERQRRGLLDMIISPAYAQATAECGTSWIGTSQGLGGSSGNRQGFIDNCRAAGWQLNFDWGDNNAFESDWRRNDDSWIDAADLVFYTGHASPNGWNVVNPDDTFMNFTEVSGVSDHWGANDLEWLIVAACGPHQSNHFTTNVGNAFDRWRDAFDGLHTFLGYGAVTFDNTSEGRRFMELTRAGWSTVDAWFRAAQEIQPATNGYSPPNGDAVIVTAMWAHDGDHCARNERIHGFGSTCADVRGRDQKRYLLWSGT